MSLPYIVCAFHTNDDIYNAEAANLRESLERFKLPYVIKQIEKGDRRWKDICRTKPRFIRDMLDAYGKDVLYLDADAKVLAHPTLFDNFPGDLGVHLRPPKELFASTIYVKNSVNARFLLERWIWFVMENDKNDDQTMLQRVVDEQGAASKCIVNLPESYACKFAEPGSGAVIGQYQASRKVRNRAAGGPI